MSDPPDKIDLQKAMAILRLANLDDPTHNINETIGKKLIAELVKAGVKNVNDLTLYHGDLPVQPAPEMPDTWRTPENEETWEEFEAAMRQKEAQVDARILKKQQAAEDMVRTGQAIYDELVKEGNLAKQRLRLGGTIEKVEKVIEPKKDNFRRNDAPRTVPPRDIPFYMRKRNKP